MPSSLNVAGLDTTQDLNLLQSRFELIYATLKTLKLKKAG